jgi:hypothetical protein
MAFLRSPSRCTDNELQSFAKSMLSAAKAFGRPHLHTGADIHRLGKNLFECRTSFNRRLLLKSGPRVITFVFTGNRDEVQAYLENTH